MRYAFVPEHRQQFTVRTTCRCLRIQPSGFYAWLKNPLSRRGREDARQTELINKAWKESGRSIATAAARRLLDQGDPVAPTVSPASPGSRLTSAQASARQPIERLLGAWVEHPSPA